MSRAGTLADWPIRAIDAVFDVYPGEVTLNWGLWIYIGILYFFKINVSFSKYLQSFQRIQLQKGIPFNCVNLVFGQLSAKKRVSMSANVFHLVLRVLYRTAR